MNRDIFNSFQAASEFAKQLAQKNAIHNLKREGDGWSVYHEGDSAVSFGQNTSLDHEDLQIEIKRKDRELNECRAQLLEKESLFTDLQREIKSLRASIANGLLTELQVERTALAEMRNDVTSQRLTFENTTRELQTQRNKLTLLENAYSKKFGKAQIQAIKELVESTAICSRCGGDGGIRGGCQRCDGTGWMHTSETRHSDVVMIEPLDHSNTLEIKVLTQADKEAMDEGWSELDQRLETEIRAGKHGARKKEALEKYDPIPEEKTQ